MLKISCILSVIAFPVFAESLVATRIIRARTILTESDFALVAAEIPGALNDTSSALGREARVTLYPGRAIRDADIAPPALVERNQLVTLIYRAGGLTMEAEGRALARGAPGEKIKIMNLSSRTVITGKVGDNGAIYVGQIP